MRGTRFLGLVLELASGLILCLSVGSIAADDIQTGITRVIMGTACLLIGRQARSL